MSEKKKQAELGADERSQQLAVFLWLAEVVQADAKKTRDRYPAQSERADQLAAFMKTACKWAAQSGQRAGVAERVLDWLRANALPNYQIVVETNKEAASLYRREVITVACASWESLIEHALAAPTQQQENND